MIYAIELMRKLGMKVPEEESEDKNYTLLLHEIENAINNTDKLPFRHTIHNTISSEYIRDIEHELNKHGFSADIIYEQHITFIIRSTQSYESCNKTH